MSNLKSKSGWQPENGLFQVWVDPWSPGKGAAEQWPPNPKLARHDLLILNPDWDQIDEVVKRAYGLDPIHQDEHFRYYG